MAAFDELLRRLAEAGVRFVVIGGLALGARGVVRGTKDVDIVVDLDSDNLKRLAQVALAGGGHVQRAGTLLGSAPSITAEIASAAPKGEVAMLKLASVVARPRAGSAPR